MGRLFGAAANMSGLSAATGRFVGFCRGNLLALNNRLMELPEDQREFELFVITHPTRASEHQGQPLEQAVCQLPHLVRNVYYVK